MNRRLPNAQYIMRALEEISIREALLLKMRWGLEDGKPCRIADLARHFNISQASLMEELKRLETQVFHRARELQDLHTN